MVTGWLLQSRSPFSSALVAVLLPAAATFVTAAVRIARDRECRVVVGNRKGSRLAGIGNGAASASDEHRVFAPLRFRIRRDGQDLPPDEMPLLKAAKTGRGVDDQDLEVVGGDG